MWKSLTDIEEHPIHKGYFISRDGKVYTNLRKITQKGVYPCRTSYEPDYTSEPRELSLSDCNGYRTCSIRNKTRFVHRLVAETFTSNPHNLPEVNHLNKNRSDNRIENLEWCDRQSNAEHGYAKRVKIQCIRTGEIFEVFNYKKWCRENNLNAGSLAHTRTGERKQHKGYRLLP